MENNEPLSLVSNRLIDCLSVGIISVDKDCLIYEVNGAAESQLGKSRSKLKGKGLSEIFKTPAVRDYVQGIVLTEEALTLRDCQLAHSHNVDKKVDCFVTPVFKKHKLIGMVLEVISLETQLRSAREEQLIRQQETTQSFLRGLAHEIKNPLGGLRGAAQLLDEELEDLDNKEYTKIIISEADRLQKLVDRMLGARRLIEKDKVNIHTLLEHIRKLVSIDLSEDIKVSFDYDPSIPELNLDKDKIVQVILNLVTNALNAIGENGEVLLRTRVVRNKTLNQQFHSTLLKLDVVDNGPGVPEKLQDTLFFPLVSGSPKGSGLGLSIAQTIANQHEGVIEFQSNKSETCFSLILPFEK